MKQIRKYINLFERTAEEIPEHELGLFISTMKNLVSDYRRSNRKAANIYHDIMMKGNFVDWLQTYIEPIWEKYEYPEIGEPAWGEFEHTVIANFLVDNPVGRFAPYVMESDVEHRDELNKTGFWGKAGAGAIIVARDTGRFLLGKRSNQVEEPGTWGCWGGAIDKGMTPEQTVEKEIKEETGYTGLFILKPLAVYEHSSGFKYFNYLAMVKGEFQPRLSWETSSYKWFTPPDWPTPLHFGVEYLINVEPKLKSPK